MEAIWNRLLSGSHIEMTSFSVKDILNLPDNGTASKTETSLERELDFANDDENIRSRSCEILSNQEQELSYRSKEQLDFVSLLKRE